MPDFLLQKKLGCVLAFSGVVTYIDFGSGAFVSFHLKLLQIKNSHRNP